MRVLQYLKCIFGRKHRFKPSASRPGYMTCTYCRHRKPSH
jgi:hypothetical protein